MFDLSTIPLIQHITGRILVNKFATFMPFLVTLAYYNFETFIIVKSLEQRLLYLIIYTKFVSFHLQHEWQTQKLLDIRPINS